MEEYVDGEKKGKDRKWKLIDKEIHLERDNGYNDQWYIYKMDGYPPTYIQCIGFLDENKRHDFDEFGRNLMDRLWKKPL